MIDFKSNTNINLKRKVQIKFYITLFIFINFKIIIHSFINNTTN